jgi:hypothetical protein
MIRDCTPEDMPWLMEMARTHYSHMITDYDSVEKWLTEAIQNPDVLLIRNEKGVVSAWHDRVFYNGTRWGGIQIMAGIGIYVARLMLYLKDFGEKHGIVWEFRSNSGRDVKKLAKILGAKETEPTYRMGG